MFTGIIEKQGIIHATTLSEQSKDQDCEFVIKADGSFSDLTLGESVACAGVCLTVTKIDISGDDVCFSVRVSPETFSCTTLGSWFVGKKINLERSLMVGQRLSGHFVLGHVDGVASLSYKEDLGESTVLGFDIPQSFIRYFNHKGSVTLDGISLTVNRVEGGTIFLNIIKHTNDITGIANLSLGDQVNFEVDVLARYVLGDGTTPFAKVEVSSSI